MNWVVETTKLSKHYGSVVALDRLDLRIAPGVTALLGPNGAGKTTLIKLLLGLIRPTGGTARVFGLSCKGSSQQIHEKIGVLHERPRFPPVLTAWRFLRFIGRLFNLHQLDQKVTEILNVVELWEVRNRMIGTYSAGMIQRLGLAQALVHRPELIFLDEPTANLDPLGRLRMLEVIRHYADDYGISFVISSHVLQDLEKVATSVAIIDQGRLLLSSKLDEMLSRSDTRFITVKISKEGIETVLQNISGVITVEPVAPFMFKCQVENIERFQSAVFQWVNRRKIRIDLFRVEEGLESLYTQTITAVEGGE